MIKRTDNAQAEQARRLRIKTQEQRLIEQSTQRVINYFGDPNIRYVASQ